MKCGIALRHYFFDGTISSYASVLLWGSILLAGDVKARRAMAHHASIKENSNGIT